MHSEIFNFQRFFILSSYFLIIFLFVNSIFCSRFQERTCFEDNVKFSKNNNSNLKLNEIGSYIDVCDCDILEGKCKRNLAKYLLVEKGVTSFEKIFDNKDLNSHFCNALKTVFQFLCFSPRMIEFIKNNQTHCSNFNQLIEDICNKNLTAKDRKTQLLRFVDQFYRDKKRFFFDKSAFDEFTSIFSNLYTFLSNKFVSVNKCKNLFTKTLTLNDFFSYECEIICYKNKKQFTILKHSDFSYNTQIDVQKINLVVSTKNEFMTEILDPLNNISNFIIRMIIHPKYLMLKIDLGLNDFLNSCYNKDEGFQHLKFYNSSYKIIGFVSYIMYLGQFALVYFHDDYLLKIHDDIESRIEFSEIQNFSTVYSIRNAIFLLEKVE